MGIFVVNDYILLATCQSTMYENYEFNEFKDGDPEIKIRIIFQV